jgi:ferredoxin
MKSFASTQKNPSFQSPEGQSKQSTNMADLENRYDDNVKGEYYVDDQCIDCDLCRETATDNFTRNEDGGYSYVYKQPTTPEERALCEEAMEGCPVEAIGRDGEEG